MLPLKHRKTRIGKVWKYTYLPFQCNVEVKMAFEADKAWVYQVFSNRTLRLHPAHRRFEDCQIIGNVLYPLYPFHNGFDLFLFFQRIHKTIKPHGIHILHGEKIANQVAQILNYTYYGEEEFFKAADELGFLSDVKKLDEKGPTFLEKFFSEKPKVYLDRLQSVVYEVAKKGDALFFGRGSQFLLNSFDCALHVLVTGSIEKRIDRVMEERRVEREVAEKIIHLSDHDKRGFLRFAFDEDWLNPHLYDLILNTDKLSIDSTVKIVIDAARSDEIKACGIDSVKSLGKLSLHQKIEAAFLEAGLTHQNLFSPWRMWIPCGFMVL